MALHCIHGCATQAGTRGGAGSTRREAEVREPGQVQAERLQPGSLCCRSPWYGSAQTPPLAACLLRLGSVSGPEVGGVGLAGTVPGTILTPCLASCPRGAVLHVDGRAKRCRSTWGRLQSDRPLQVSPRPWQCLSSYRPPGALTAAVTSCSLLTAP